MPDYIGVTDATIEALAAIHAEYGKLRPDVVVAEAARADSPLHDHFTWDDTEAARLHRLEEARGLIRRVRVRVITHVGPIEVRRYVHVDDGADPYYADEETIRGDPKVAADVLRHMELEWMALRRRWQHLAEFWRVVGDDWRDAA